MKIHTKYMLRCIQLAKNGWGTTYPNPMVGCVIVYRDRIIGEGYTSSYGGPHAEVNALNAVRDKSLLKDSVLYVTLEPCSHFGKTPPCADMIVAQGIRQVVIGTMDPNTKVAGKGIEKLKQGGCEVQVGVMEPECREHHRRFLTFQEKKRPYIILKWAETLDGFMAPAQEHRGKNPEPFWITHENSRKLVHKWRSEEQAILVGTCTVMEDNPQLDVRHWSGKSPVRVILDRDLKLDPSFHVFDGSVKTIVLTQVADKNRYKESVHYERVDFSGNLASEICNALYRNEIVSVMIEGGPRTLKTFIEADLWDEARVFTGNVAFGKGLKAPTLDGQWRRSVKIGADRLNYYRNDQKHHP